MNMFIKYLIVLIIFTNLFFLSILKAEENIDFNFGKNIDQNIISKLDITIDALGSNLPDGEGNAKIGEKIFLNKCVSCHLEKDIFNQTKIIKRHNVNSVPINLDWPYPKALYDYIRKAMPYNAPQTLSTNETYALTAYLLYKNNILNFDEKLDKKSLLDINSTSKHTLLDTWNLEKNNIINSSNDKTSSLIFKLSQTLNKQDEEINWYNNSVSINDIKQKIIAKDISISPTSKNLPEGNGTAEIGKIIYQERCVSCHGTEGKAEELSREVESFRGNSVAWKIIKFESLSGGLGTLNTEIPVRTVGSFWPHATTLFDYIRRAMPYFEPQSLTNDEAYAVTAYVLYINKIINKTDNINARTLTNIIMPNKTGFIDSWGPDWWREWIHQKYAILFTSLLLLGVLIIILFARKITQYRKQITYTKIFLTGIIFLWLGVFQGLQIGTQKIYQSYNTLKLDNGIWDNILFEPIYVILGAFVIITTLIWGRGIFCGWLCPFGIIQDLIHKISKILKFNNFEIPNYIHSKLIYLKYIILSAIVLSAIYTTGSNIFLEFEPFKTVIEYKFNTSTILILWSLAILVFVFFIERGFCRYLCPTGAALALASQFQVINWLTTVNSCGIESCSACLPKCPTKAIAKNGSINEKECIQCLSCQIAYNDKNIKCNNKRKSSIRTNITSNKLALRNS